MEDQSRLFELLDKGNVEGFGCVPKKIETVISRVYIFEDENKVLKFYKRDNEWWNNSLRDISHGASRFGFIREDFAFNRYLNPKIYTEIKTAVVQDDCVMLVEPQRDDDEIVIVMNKQDLSVTLAGILFDRKLSMEDYTSLGRDFVRIKQVMPKDFLPKIETSWYEQILERVRDLEVWVASEPDFPKRLSQEILTWMKDEIEKNRARFQAMKRDTLSVCVDCHTENLLFENGKLSFMDAYPPKELWRIGAFELDIFRVGADIYAFAGEDAYRAYLAGTQGGDVEEVEKLYLMYGVVLACSYFLMLAKKNQEYRPKAERYLGFVERASRIEK